MPCASSRSSRIARRSSSSASSRRREEESCGATAGASEPDEALLGSVVEVALQPFARSTSPASTMRARDARSSASRARTSAWRRSFSSASARSRSPPRRAARRRAARSMREHRYRATVADEARAFLSVSNLDAAAVRVDERSRVPDRVPEDEPCVPDDPGERLASPREAATAPARRPAVRPTRGRVAPAPSPGDSQREPEGAAAWPSQRRRSSSGRGSPGRTPRRTSRRSAPGRRRRPRKTRGAPPRKLERIAGRQGLRSDARRPQVHAQLPENGIRMRWHWSAISTRLSGHQLQPSARGSSRNAGSTPRTRIAPA